MWIADGWKDYEVIDCSDGEKLECWIRPAEKNWSGGEITFW